MLEKDTLERRLSALRAGLEARGLAAAVLSRPQHLFYFTGVQPGAAPAFLLALPRETVAVAPAPLGDLETVTYVSYDIHQGWSLPAGASAALEQALAGSGLEGRAVGAELDHLPALYLQAIGRHAGPVNDLGELLWGLRRVKDGAEIAQIEANVAANDRVFAALQRTVRAGMTELEVWGMVYRDLCEEAGEPITLEADLGAGVRAANSDAKPGHARLEKGDAMLLDMYSASHGYYADTTRVFTLGPATERQREIHDILEEALAAGEGALRPGVAACDVDRAVRGAIERAGYGPNFPHHSGHSYGLFQQERPYIIPAERMPLEEGMILTLEPGIYVAGWGGMRLESNYLLTAGGARRLDTFPRQLVVC